MKRELAHQRVVTGPITPTLAPTMKYDELMIYEDEPPRACLCLDPIAAGFFVALLLLLEGTLVGFNVVGFFGQHHEWWSGLMDHNPFRSTQWHLLGALSLGDIVFALIGAMGMFMSTNGSLTPKDFAASHATVVCRFIGSLLLWRSIVALTTAPFVGVLLAFEPPPAEKALVFTLTMLYVGVSAYITYVLFMTYREAATEAERVQQVLDSEWREQRGRMIWVGIGGRTGGLPNEIIGVDSSQHRLLICLPLEATIGLYTCVVGIIFAILFFDICLTGRTVGGWAFLIQRSSTDDSMMVAYEAIVYGCSALTCIFGLAAIVMLGVARNESELSPVTVNLDDKGVQRGTAVLVIYLLGSILRLALFVPITTMKLFEMDFCGTFVYGLASTSLSKNGSPLQATVHCGRSELFVLFAVVFVAALDIYFITAVARLWRLYQNRTLLRAAGTQLQYGTPDVASKAERCSPLVL